MGVYVMRHIGHFIGGAAAAGEGDAPVFDPLTGPDPGVRSEVG
jgi:hypothetical protein